MWHRGQLPGRNQWQAVIFWPGELPLEGNLKSPRSFCSSWTNKSPLPSQIPELRSTDHPCLLLVYSIHHLSTFQSLALVFGVCDVRAEHLVRQPHFRLLPWKYNWQVTHLLTRATYGKKKDKHLKLADSSSILWEKKIAFENKQEIGTVFYSDSQV